MDRMRCSPDIVSSHSIDGLPRHVVYADLSRRAIVLGVFVSGREVLQINASRSEVLGLLHELHGAMKALSDYETTQDAIVNGHG